jgi:CheY-like chemotaxis protein
MTMAAQTPESDPSLEPAPATVGAAAKVEPPPRVEAARRTVLVVEDDPANRELLVELLALWGYRTVPVGSAEEAEYAVRTRRPDAALVDVFLPGRSGATLMARLRERFPDVVLIGMSALSDAAMARKCKGLGADLFIGKPISAEVLADALQTPHRSWH